MEAPTPAPTSLDGGLVGPSWGSTALGAHEIAPEDAQCIAPEMLHPNQGPPPVDQHKHNTRATRIWADREARDRTEGLHNDGGAVIAGSEIDRVAALPGTSGVAAGVIERARRRTRSLKRRWTSRRERSLSVGALRVVWAGVG